MRNCRSNLLIFLLSFVRCWVTCGSNLIVPLRAAVVSVCFSLGVASSILCSPIREWEANSSDSSPVGSKLPALIGLDSTSSQKGQFPGPERLMMPQNPVIPRRFLHLFPTNLRGHVATLWWLPWLCCAPGGALGLLLGGMPASTEFFLLPLISRTGTEVGGIEVSESFAKSDATAAIQIPRAHGMSRRYVVCKTWRSVFDVLIILNPFWGVLHPSSKPI